MEFTDLLMDAVLCEAELWPATNLLWSWVRSSACPREVLLESAFAMGVGRDTVVTCKRNDCLRWLRCLRAPHAGQWFPPHSAARARFEYARLEARVDVFFPLQPLWSACWLQDVDRSRETLALHVSRRHSHQSEAG